MSSPTARRHAAITALACLLAPGRATNHAGEGDAPAASPPFPVLPVTQSSAQVMPNPPALSYPGATANQSYLALGMEMPIIATAGAGSPGSAELVFVSPESYLLFVQQGMTLDGSTQLNMSGGLLSSAADPFLSFQEPTGLFSSISSATSGSSSGSSSGSPSSDMRLLAVLLYSPPVAQPGAAAFNWTAWAADMSANPSLRIDFDIQDFATRSGLGEPVAAEVLIVQDEVITPTDNPDDNLQSLVPMSTVIPAAGQAESSAAATGASASAATSSTPSGLGMMGPGGMAIGGGAGQLSPSGSGAGASGTGAAAAGSTSSLGPSGSDSGADSGNGDSPSSSGEQSDSEAGQGSGAEQGKTGDEQGQPSGAGEGQKGGAEGEQGGAEQGQGGQAQDGQPGSVSDSGQQDGGVDGSSDEGSNGQDSNTKGSDVKGSGGDSTDGESADGESACDAEEDQAAGPSLSVLPGTNRTMAPATGGAAKPGGANKNGLPLMGTGASSPAGMGSAAEAPQVTSAAEMGEENDDDLFTIGLDVDGKFGVTITAELPPFRRARRTVAPHEGDWTMTLNPEARLALGGLMQATAASSINPAVATGLSTLVTATTSPGQGALAAVTTSVSSSVATSASTSLSSAPISRLRVFFLASVSLLFWNSV